MNNNILQRIFSLIALLAIAATPATAQQAQKVASPELKQVLKDIQQLKGEEVMGLASWLKAEGRAKLKQQGATDSDIGPARFDIDRFGEAPLGK
jgi:hypothetical protein